MRKLSHFLRYGTVLHEKMFLEKAGNTKGALWLNGFSSRAEMSPAGQDLMSKVPAGNLSDRVFADYSLFKGKAALSISPILPRFSTTDSGFHKVDKRGCMILKFWPAVGQRKYDYEKRQVFALSPTELGSLISLGPNESCEFFHDPSMQTSNAGQVRKSLSFSPISDGGGYFLNLNVVNNSLKTNERFSVPVSKAEFAVMRTAFSFMLPHIMGWDWYTSQLPSGKVDHYKSSLATKNFEWDK